MLDLTAERQTYPRVSDILSPYSKKDFESISPEVLAHAAERGTKVHKYCTGYVRGLWLPDIEEECQPYVDSFIQWYDKNCDKTLFYESRLYDDALRYTGEIDLIVILKDGSRTLVDIKTSATVSKSWIVQLAAYKNLLSVNNIEINYTLNLQVCKTGKLAKEYSHNAENLTQAWDLFKGLIKAYDYFIRKPLKKEALDETATS
jgi:RecB family exonuclease